LWQQCQTLFNIESGTLLWESRNFLFRKVYVADNLVYKVVDLSYDPSISLRAQDLAGEFSILKLCAEVAGVPSPIAYRKTDEFEVIVMKRLPGEPLSNLTVGWFRMFIILAKLGIILLRLSWRGISHNDIIPDNILVASDNSVSLVDFDQATRTKFLVAIVRQFFGIVKCSGRGIDILKKNYNRLQKYYSGKPFGQAGVFEKAWVTDIFQEMTELGVPLHCVILERGWMEIDTPEDYERALTDTKFVRRLVKRKTDWNKRAKFYNSLDWVNKDVLLSQVVEVAGVLKDEKVLDIGTGTGKVLIALKEQCPEADYYGVDISQSMLDKIEASYGFNLSIRAMEDLQGVKDSDFDLVTARMVFHHATNLEEAMNEVYRVLKPGGRFVLCEGNPPDRYSITFYKDMFRFKEDRITFLLDDLVNLFVRQKFREIASRTVILRDMSLNNWLENSGLPFRNVDIIKKMHYDCDVSVQEAYNMKFKNDDILMDWKFSVVLGIK